MASFSNRRTLREAPGILRVLVARDVNRLLCFFVLRIITQENRTIESDKFSSSSSSSWLSEDTITVLIEIYLKKKKRKYPC